MTGGLKRHDRLSQGAHIAYVFSSNAEKQSSLFQLCEHEISSQNHFVLYLSGKQGVKGIRLSLKDVGFDVAFYERAKQFRIIDSEEWFFASGRQKLFKAPEEIKAEIAGLAGEAVSCGYPQATIISETDALVRKGFYPKYLELDNFLGKELLNVKASLVCAFDQRELEAAGAKNYREEIGNSHSAVI
jgi:hypothetical protein